MNEILLNMYVVAVETGRIDIDFVPLLYRDKVKEVLKLA
jgi:hypothetical protein